MDGAAASDDDARFDRAHELIAAILDATAQTTTSLARVAAGEQPAPAPAPAAASEALFRAAAELRDIAGAAVNSLPGPQAPPALGADAVLDRRRAGVAAARVELVHAAVRDALAFVDVYLAEHNLTLRSPPS